jgi:hypothetical protein
VASPKNVRSLDTILTTLFEIYFWDQDTFLKKCWFLNEELNFVKNVEKDPINFDINILNIKESNLKVTLSPFYPSIHNFYMTNSISANSSVMGECSLFLNIKTNFSLES